MRLTPREGPALGAWRAHPRVRGEVADNQLRSCRGRWGLRSLRRLVLVDLADEGLHSAEREVGAIVLVLIGCEVRHLEELLLALRAIGEEGGEGSVVAGERLFLEQQLFGLLAAARTLIRLLLAHEVKRLRELWVVLLVLLHAILDGCHFGASTLYRVSRKKYC